MILKPRTFLCQCGRTANTIKPDVTKCVKCRKGTNYKNCTQCNKKFYSSGAKTICRVCMSEHPENNPKYHIAKMNKLYKSSCDDVHNWTTEIKLLYIKKRNNLISPIDSFRIANIYMTVICDENRFSSHTAEEQAVLMINELWQLLIHDIKPPKTKKGRKKKTNF